MLVVDIGKADAGVGKTDEDLVALEVVAVGGRFLYRSVFGSFEDSKVVAHDECVVLIGVDKIRLDLPCRNQIVSSFVCEVPRKPNL